MNAPSKPETNALTTLQPHSFDLSPRNFEEAWRQAEIMADSDMVPKDFKGRPGNCLIAVQWGAEIGLKSMQSVQNIAVINGRPSLWGDAMLALVRASPLCRYVIETDDGHTASCRTWRNGEPQEQVRTFSMEDAKLAGLLGKQGPWTQYPKRMRQMRARGWLLRDVYTDILKGLHMAEEAMDMPPAERFMGPADVVQPTTATTEPPATYPQEQFATNLPKWHAAIAGGRKSADQIISMAETKHPLTDAQKAEIRKAAPAPAADQPQDVAPKVTFAHVAEKMNAAADTEQLAVAASFIAAVPDEQHRAELKDLYERRAAELPF